MWRSSPRHRSPRIEEAGRPVPRLAKARAQMPGKRTEGVSALSGLSGLSLVRALGPGERAPHALARGRDRRGQARTETSARALQGPWQPEHLGALQPSLA